VRSIWGKKAKRRAKGSTCKRSLWRKSEIRRVSENFFGSDSCRSPLAKRLLVNQPVSALLEAWNVTSKKFIKISGDFDPPRETEDSEVCNFRRIGKFFLMLAPKINIWQDFS
jgi:hypothetical protein